jgi:hypothetical protein
MAETPTSQVPFAAGRTSLVGTPARIANPAEAASEELARQAAKEQTLAARRQNEQLSQARMDMELQGTKALELARQEALKQTDPDAVVAAYEDTVGTQLLEMKQGLTNPEDIAAFEIQMDRRMSAHQLDLDSHQLNLTRQHQLASTIEYQEALAATTNTTNLATIELAKRQMRDRLEEQTQFGSIDPVRAQAQIEAFEEQADLAYVGALAAKEEYDLALQAIGDEKLTPDMSPATRQKAVEQIKGMRSNQAFSEFSVRIDRMDPQMMGVNGEQVLDTAHASGLLNDTHWRQLSNKQASTTGRFQQSEEPSAMWRMFKRGEALNRNSEHFEAAVNIGFQEFQLENPGMGYDQAAVAFSQEYGLIAPDAFNSAVNRTMHSDMKTSIQGAELLGSLESFAGMDEWKSMRTRKPAAKAVDRAMMYRKQRWGSPLADVKGKQIDADEASGLAGSRDGVPQPLLSPEDAMQAVWDFQKRATSAPAAERARRRHELKQLWGGQDGRTKALEAFNYVANSPAFGFNEDEVPRVVIDSILASAIESMAQGRLDEDTAFLGAAYDEVLTLGIDGSKFHGRNEITRYPPDLALPRAKDPTSGRDLGHVPYVADMNLRIADQASQVMDDPILQQVVDEFAASPEYTTGKRMPPLVDPGSIGGLMAIASGSDFRPTLGAIVEEWAARKDINLQRAWADFNAALWGQGGTQGGLAFGPGPLAWEPELEGDDVTATGVTAEGGRAPLSWLVMARTSDGAFHPLTNGGAPLGERIGFHKHVRNPVLRSQHFNKTRDQMIQELEALGMPHSLGQTMSEMAATLEAGRKERARLQQIREEGVQAIEREAFTTLPRPG